MGSSFAPSIANLFMAQLEEKFILNETQNPFFPSVLLFRRYVDDCFCVYNDLATLKQFLDWLNQVHPTIYFTVDGN